MLNNNKTRLTFTKNLKSQNDNNHINVMHHHIQKLVENKELGIKWISSSLILIINLTKVLLIGLFKRY